MQEEIQKESKEIHKVDWDFLYEFSIFFQKFFSFFIESALFTEALVGVFFFIF